MNRQISEVNDRARSNDLLLGSDHLNRTLYYLSQYRSTQRSQCFDFPVTSEAMAELSLHLQAVRGDVPRGLRFEKISEAPKGVAIELPLADICRTTEVSLLPVFSVALKC
jgi:hypothetical protein